MIGRALPKVSASPALFRKGFPVREHDTPQAPTPDVSLPVTPEEFRNLAEASMCVVGSIMDLALGDPAALGMVIAAGLDAQGKVEPWTPSLRRCVLALQRLADLPADEGAIFDLALALGEAGDWPQAERAARAALRILANYDGESYPTPACVGGLLARALLKQGRREEARAVALEARDQAADRLDGEAAYEVLAELLDAGELAKLYLEPKAQPAAQPEPEQVPVRYDAVRLAECRARWPGRLLLVGFGSLAVAFEEDARIVDKYGFRRACVDGHLASIVPGELVAGLVGSLLAAGVAVATVNDAEPVFARLNAAAAVLKGGAR